MTKGFEYMRVKIKLPDTLPLYQSDMTLGVADMNYGDHLGNDRVLTLAHEARLRLMQSLNMDELNFYGSSLIMTDAMVQYISQGHRGDKVIIDLWQTNLTAYGFDYLYSIKKQKDSKEIARIKTGMLFYDYELSKPARCPEKFNQDFSQD